MKSTKYGARHLLAIIIVMITLHTILPSLYAAKAQLQLEDQFQLLDYIFGDQDGDFDVIEMSQMMSHHLGAVVLVMYLDYSKEFVLDVKKKSDEYKQKDTYRKAHEVNEVGLAIIAKARQLHCLNELIALKGGDKSTLTPETIAMFDMVDLSAAYLASIYSWDISEIMDALQKHENAREGYSVFIKAIMSDSRLPSIHTGTPVLPHKHRVVTFIQNTSNGSLTPSAVATFSSNIPGKGITDKVDNILSRADK